MDHTLRDLGDGKRYATNCTDVIVGDGLFFFALFCAVMGCAVDLAGD
ncbi:hypothetical protein K239x_29720 [Planctomycetes bacterium K23_9]|uniref:Uncharacterized protein n=1 Tax=Stieleria marina TaxID=1930275 RepID=A0A517NV29_9BACT|nr:hypothetical protein K239x_29720 [Planctomycetes bacterium K23_9]